MAGWNTYATADECARTAESIVDARWTDFNRRRVQRRFRHHVRTKWNPTGRIHREACRWCPKNVSVSEPETEDEARANKQLSEAHHPDYDRPFVVVWVCYEHHRAIERGEIRFGKRDVWDYTSLVVTRQGAWKKPVIEEYEGEEVVPF